MFISLPGSLFLSYGLFHLFQDMKLEMESLRQVAKSIQLQYKVMYDSRALLTLNRIGVHLLGQKIFGIKALH